jgi:MoxR-like ATPase
VEHASEFQEKAACFVDTFRRIESEVAKVIVGQRNLIADVLTGLFAGGHVLLEGVPGTGKTLLVHTLAEAVDCKFSRIQFTPDLMPSDIIGTRIVEEDEHGRKQFSFQPGPVFTQMLLADEINRATPKTQSALLEAMQEKMVTVANERRTLGPPFFVLATQNPLEMEGTYPLPEAQLDRFMFKLNVDYPSLDELVKVSQRTTTREMPKASAVITDEELLAQADVVRDVPVAEHVERYAAQILMASHPESDLATEDVKRYVRYGASPRGLQGAILGGKVRAMLDDRINVAKDDIRDVMQAALRHRILLNFEGEAEEVNPDDIIQGILETIEIDVP